MGTRAEHGGLRSQIDYDIDSKFIVRHSRAYKRRPRRRAVARTQDTYPIRRLREIVLFIARFRKFHIVVNIVDTAIRDETGVVSSRNLHFFFHPCIEYEKSMYAVYSIRYIAKSNKYIEIEIPSIEPGTVFVASGRYPSEPGLFKTISFKHSRLGDDTTVAWDIEIMGAYEILSRSTIGVWKYPVIDIHVDQFAKHRYSDFEL